VVRVGLGVGTKKKRRNKKEAEKQKSENNAIIIKGWKGGDIREERKETSSPGKSFGKMLLEHFET
jgi:hypothetical protein